MVSALLLAAYATTAGTLGAAWLRDSGWPALSPRLAITAWLGLATSILLALSASGLALAVSLPHVSQDLARLFDLCVESLRHGYASPGGKLAAIAGGAVFLALVARTAWCVIAATITDSRERTSRLAILDLVARTGIVPGALVIDHAAPYAFCIGGRHRRVVVTSGLLDALDQDELNAVLAHEKAHLRQQHHLLLLACQALFNTLVPLFPPFRRALSQVRLFAELSADDHARSRVGARPLAAALASLTSLAAPAGGLAASELGVEARLERLTSPGRAMTVGARALTVLAIGAAVLLPLVLAAGPAIAVTWEGICRLA